MRPRIGLVLGGGGSRGMAHIGVLEVLVRERIPIDLIVGTSMGAIVGSLFASGMPTDVIAEQVGKWQGNKLLNTNLFSARARQRVVEQQLSLALKDKTFDQLHIPLVVMAVDMLSGREVGLTSGLLIPAILASSALPAVFPPVEMNGMKLADGGVIDSLSTHTAFEYGADMVIAVDIYPPLEQGGWSDPLGAIMGLDMPLLNNGSVSAIWRSVRIITHHLHVERLAAHPPHVLLRPDVSAIGSLDFKDLQVPLNAGRIAAESQLDALKALMREITEA